MIERLFPKQADNRFAGHRAALWLMGLYLALKLTMGFNSIFSTAKVAANADGIPLHTFSPDAAREVLTLFALTGLGQLALAVMGLIVLVRYRALVLLIYVMLLGEALARRMIVESYAATRTESGTVGFYINIGLLALLALGLLLSILPPRRQLSAHVET